MKPRKQPRQDKPSKLPRTVARLEIDNCDVYLLGVVHDSAASMRGAEELVASVLPDVVCLEQPQDNDGGGDEGRLRLLDGEQWSALQRYREFLASPISLSGWFGLRRHGYKHHVLAKWVGARRDRLQVYAAAQRAPGGSVRCEMGAAEGAARRVDAAVHRIDLPHEIAEARVWALQDVGTRLAGAAVRWGSSVDGESVPDEWKSVAPEGWAQHRSESELLAAEYDLSKHSERRRLADDVNGTRNGKMVKNKQPEPADPGRVRALNVLHGPARQVWLYERDLILARGLHSAAVGAAAKAGKGGRGRVVGVVGLAHVPGIVDNWATRTDVASFCRPDAGNFSLKRRAQLVAPILFAACGGVAAWQLQKEEGFWDFKAPQ